MAVEAICKLLKDRFGGDIVGVELDGAHPHVVVNAERWPQIARFLRDEPQTNLKFLRSISGLDLLDENKLAAVYDLMDIVPGRAPEELWRTTLEFAVRIEVDRERPHIPTVSDVWPTADWHEREAYDLLGIVFDGHPDLRRILCPDDWVGHPLRKDYEFPLEYHGIPGTTEYDLPNPVH